MTVSKNVFFGIVLCFGLAFGNHVNADVVYTITGYANNIGNPDDPLLSPEVEAGETYSAVFQIDDSVMDSDASSGRGSYLNAIVSSSITFSGGYSSMVDFAGGEVVIQENIGGGAIGLSSPSGNGSILLASFEPFPSDALVTDPGTEILGSPFSLWSLTEPSGLIVSFSDVGLGPINSGPIVLTVSSVPEPSTAALLALSSIACFVRRRK